MTRAAIDQLLYLMRQAFEGHGASEHSLLANLTSLTDGDWLWVPTNGARRIRQIVGHVAACKYMYDDHAFRDGKMSWTDPAGDLGCSMEHLQSGPPLESEPHRQRVIEWLTEGHNRLRTDVEALSDDTELAEPRKSNWGEDYETRWLISVMVQHDLYHAGEINHNRALHEGNDAWPNW